MTGYELLEELRGIASEVGIEPDQVVLTPPNKVRVGSLQITVDSPESFLNSLKEADIVKDYFLEGIDGAHYRITASSPEWAVASYLREVDLPEGPLSYRGKVYLLPQQKQALAEDMVLNITLTLPVKKDESPVVPPSHDVSLPPPPSMPSLSLEPAPPSPMEMDTHDFPDEVVEEAIDVAKKEEAQGKEEKEIKESSLALRGRIEEDLGVAVEDLSFSKEANGYVGSFTYSVGIGKRGSATFEASSDLRKVSYYVVGSLGYRVFRVVYKDNIYEVQERTPERAAEVVASLFADEDPHRVVESILSNGAVEDAGPLDLNVAKGLTANRPWTVSRVGDTAYLIRTEG